MFISTCRRWPSQRARTSATDFTRASPRAGHGMPLIADAAGVEAKWIARARRLLQRGRLRRHELRFAVGREEPTLREEAPLGQLPARAQRPLHRLERLIVRVRNGRERADVEVARAIVLERGERGVLAEHV